MHRGALMSDGGVEGNNLICGVHDWDYRLDTGVSEYSDAEALNSFMFRVEGGQVLVDAGEISELAKEHPQPFNRDAYLA